jgi:hypothetical protein
MMLARRGLAVRVSLVNCYLGAGVGWLMVTMAKGAAERAAWLDPVFIGFMLFGLAVIAIALDRMLVLLVRGDMLLVFGIFRRHRLHRDSCRFVVERYGSLRRVSHALLLTDGRQRRRIAHYWMWGGILAERAAERLRKNLLEDAMTVA